MAKQKQKKITKNAAKFIVICNNCSFKVEVIGKTEAYNVSNKHMEENDTHISEVLAEASKN